MAKHSDPVTEYANSVLSGKVVAGFLVKLACQRHINDLNKFKESKQYYFDVEAANRAIDFCRFLKHSKGEWAGKPIELEPWQKFIRGSLFGWKNKEGKRRFNTAYLEVARKNGKTTDLAGIGIYLLDADGEAGAEVYSAATKRDQAKILFNEAKRMVKKSKALSNRIKVYTNNLSVEATDSKFEPLGADGDTMDGLNSHANLIDELHAHKTREVWDVLETATGSRTQPLTIGITTAGFNQHGICYEQRDYCIKVLKGVFRDDSYFAYIATLDRKADGADTDDDWQDEKNWIKANPNLGVSVKIKDMRRLAEKAKQIPAALNNFLCKRLNVWVNQSERWMSLDAWDKCGSKFDIEELKGIAAYGGLDLSNRIDITASVCVVEKSGIYHVIPRFYIPEDIAIEKERTDKVPYTAWARNGLVCLTPGNVVDKDWIEHDFREYFNKMFVVKEVAYDSWQADSVVQHLGNDGLTMVPVNMGTSGMNQPTNDLMMLVLQKKLAHGGNPVLRWMADNMVTRKDSNGRIRPDKDKAHQKIDGIVALILAISRAMVHNDDTSVYESRGVRRL